jgi:polyisoprenoid-binding protein YceI
MLKRRLSLLSAALILPLLLAACGGSAEATPTAAPAVEVAATDSPAAEVVATEAPTEETITETEAVTETGAGESAAEAPAAAVTRTFVATAGNGSSAQYAVEEEFFGQAVPFVTAVGTTDQVDGSITLEVSDAGISVVDGSFTVNLTSLTSDQGRRDNAIRRDWLQSNTYPEAIFSNIAAVNLPAQAVEGADVAFQLAGDLTVRETPQPVTWDVTARVENGTLTGTAVTNILMADYGFEAPNIGGMLRVTDGVTVTLNLVATEQ